MTEEEVKQGDIIHSSDDTLIKVHHIGDYGEVYYIAYADNARGRLGKYPYLSFYGYIERCYPATDAQKSWLEDWIKAKQLHP